MTQHLQPVMTSLLATPLPIRPPVSGEYGRLDSRWRVRSHLETLGQPKAGTVTITQPWSPRGNKRSCEDGTQQDKSWGRCRGNNMGRYDDQWSAREYKKSPPVTWLFWARCGQATAMQGTMWSMASSSFCLLMAIRSELRDEAHTVCTWNKDSSATLQD